MKYVPHKIREFFLSQTPTNKNKYQSYWEQKLTIKFPKIFNKAQTYTHPVENKT